MCGCEKNIGLCQWLSWCLFLLCVRESLGKQCDQLKGFSLSLPPPPPSLSRVVGPPCVFSCHLQRQPLPASVRPTYSCTMEGTVLCFTGFKDKDLLVSALSLSLSHTHTHIHTHTHTLITSPLLSQHSVCNKAHLMGASIRKDMTSSVTHVVAHSVSGSKYKVRPHPL